VGEVLPKLRSVLPALERLNGSPLRWFAKDDNAVATPGRGKSWRLPFAGRSKQQLHAGWAVVISGQIDAARADALAKLCRTIDN
jgi:hypothetical protein